MAEYTPAEIAERTKAFKLCDELPQYMKQAFDEIDAGLFSGDFFMNDDMVMMLRVFLVRWEKGLQEVEESLKE